MNFNRNNKKSMKKLVLFLSVIVLTANFYAQSINKFSYQTVLRDKLGKLISNRSVGVRLSILQFSSSGSAVYVETHSATSNVNGMIDLKIGSGTIVSGAFSSINWSHGPFFLKTEIDVNGGMNYAISGVTEFVSVPYAKLAEKVSTLSNGTTIGDMNYWNGTNWEILEKGNQGQRLSFCNDKPLWVDSGVCPGTISTLNCSSAISNGTLNASTTASSVTSDISYTGGNGSPHNGQIATSTGVTGLTATLKADNFGNGNGNLTYVITGIPSSSGTANFTINIGGKNCILSRTVGVIIGTVSSIVCSSPTNNGSITAKSSASGVSSVITYSGGNGKSHNGQTVNSTGVLGLKATLQAGNFVNGTGNLTYTISGTPTTSGTAYFAINIGGKTCVLSRSVAIATQQPSSGYGTNITDIDGNTYKTVYIGTQHWMGENLKVSKYNDGTIIPNVSDASQWAQLTTGAWAYYNNNSVNNTKYGKLYNWYTIDSTTNGKKNICPTGWHVPNDAEWTVLTEFLGGDNSAGGKMKEVGTTNWSSPNSNAVNTSIFTGRPGGYRLSSGKYGNFNVLGYWWSSNLYYVDNAWYLNLFNYSGGIYKHYSELNRGYSVRCIKNR